VRAIAAFLVFFHHHPTSALVFGPLHIGRELHVGVTFFFVLSGLLIAWRYDDPREDRIRSLPVYFLNRFARIYPLYLFLVIPALILRHQTEPRDWLLNLTLLKGFSDQFKFSGIGQAWSLTVEECFYATAPLLFLLWRRGSGRVLAVGAAVFAAAVSLSTLPAVSSAIGPPRFIILYTYFGRFFEFFVGVWLAKRLAPIAGLPPRRGYPRLTAAGVSGIVLVVVALAWIGRDDFPSFGVYRPQGMILNNLVLPLFIAALYAGLVREKSVVRSILSTRTADLLGRGSYAFYLVHYGPVLVLPVGWLVSLVGIAGPGAASAAAGFLNGTAGLFLLVLGLSIALYALVERPADRAIRRLAGGSRNERTAAATAS
jgi:peptidoglycan/LPS O-acetylase OafA/YrhL